MVSLDKLAQQFLAIQTPEQLASVLNIDFSKLIYRVRIAPQSKKYICFALKKKNGDNRLISAPVGLLKNVQRRLNRLLTHLYKPKKAVHGFALKRSIITNASVHVGQRFILNIDLKDFFPSINFGRVRGLFLSYPFRFRESVATFLAQICCHQNQLPQGAPTSPVISNYICAKMDRELSDFAAKYKSIYTRYADDLTISTALKTFPNQIAHLARENYPNVTLGTELTAIIQNNGFSINSSKTRLTAYYQRQEVTGLIVNEKTNIRRKYYRKIRAMLYAWKKFGYAAAQQRYFELHDCKQKNPMTIRGSFESIVRGKLAFLKMVRKKDVPASAESGKLTPYKRLWRDYKNLMPSEKYQIRRQTDDAIFIVTEGESDWKHLKAALKRFQSVGMYKKLDITFDEQVFEPPMNNTKLLDYCKYFSLRHHDQTKLVFIFDSDDGRVNKEVAGPKNKYKKWGNNVYSFILPCPDHRHGVSGLSIELFYQDRDLTQKAPDNRRLFLNTEFNQKTFFHNEKPEMSCSCHSKIKGNKLCVIDEGVYNSMENTFALSKKRFADYVLSEHLNFKDFDISQFEKIFNLIEEIDVEKSDMII